MSYKSYARSYECILIKDDILKMAILGDVNVLHDNTILDGRILSDRNASENNGTLDLTIDAATVGYDRIAHVCVVEIKRRSFILDLRVDRVTAPEEVVYDGILNDRHGSVEVCLNAVDPQCDTGIFEALNLELSEHLND